MDGWRRRNEEREVRGEEGMERRMGKGGEMGRRGEGVEDDGGRQAGID